MCAIAGILGLTFNEPIIRNMLHTMQHRGPDGNGVAMTAGSCLLHSRLAIIDPKGGQQPMKLRWQGRGYTLVYNGELYNTEELRDELLRLGHVFDGHSDTEVVLHAFAQWGESCVERFNGIYAFAVWIRESKALFFARDRMGVKPLFYTEHQGGLLFASEIKTILAYPTVERTLDAEGVAELLLLGPGRKPGSGVFKGIHELEPGCCGWYRDGKLQLRRYWQLKDREHGDDFEQTVEQVRYLVKDAITRQMVSDVPIGTFLSGGLDSSLITAVCCEATDGHLPTFSLDFVNNEKFFRPEKFQPNSDNSYIRLMQERFRTEHHWSVLEPETVMTALETAVEARDLPGMADVDSSLLLFCGEIAQSVKVALSGECADEIFGGYPWFRDPEVLAANGFPWAQNTMQRMEFMHPDFKINGEDFVRSCYEDTIAQTDILPGTSPEERRMKQMVNLNYRWFMQTLLDRKDRMSMHHSLEVRVPFCDHRIAEYMYAVPWEYKNYQGAEKGLLRYAMNGLLPDAVLWRKKSPYPKTHDPKYLELVSNALRDLLRQSDAPILKIVKREALENLLNAQYVWPWYGQLMKVPQTIAYMLQINHWLGKYSVTIQ